MIEVGEKAKAMWAGDKPYQLQARSALPILVRQARAKTPIFYSALAAELGMPNPRNLDYVLGSVGVTLNQISPNLGCQIPPIQFLVISKQTDIPGTGISTFVSSPSEFKKLPRKAKKVIVDAALAEVYAFQRWDDVLTHLHLKEATNSIAEVEAARKYAGFGGGESDAHKALKEFVRKNPSICGLPPTIPAGETEFSLASGDSLDVHFVHRSLRVAVEVKSHISGIEDIERGLFQCVKYLAVVEAEQSASGKEQNARAVLVLESKLPERLVKLKNTLGVEVIEEIKVA
jgi:hypothetical protein